MLISGEEIFAIPYDQLTYIDAASHGYWFGDNYTVSTFVRLPIYPLYISLIYLTGLPLRIAIDMLYLVSGFAFVVALSKSNFPMWLCVAAYCMIVFHPVSFQLFNHSLPETLYVSVLLLALASLIMLLLRLESPQHVTYALLTGISFSLLWHIRPENILIIGIFILLLFITFLISKNNGLNVRQLFRQIGVIIAVPISIVILVSLLIRTGNFIKFGLFVPYEIEAGGYTAAYKALLRIYPARSIRFVPVSKASRTIAYTVSPSFRELEPFLESESNMWANVTRKEMNIKNDIAAGWFYWALRDAVSLAGHYRSAREADAYYKRIADEINSAIDDGRLPGRTVLFSFLDPEVSNYLPYLGESFLKMWRLFTSVDEPARKKEDPTLSEDVRKAFDIVANRRAALTGDSVVTLRGWAFHDGKEITQILLRTADGKVLASTDQFSPRPDVAKSYKANGIENVPENTGFTLTTPQGQQLPDAYLVIVTNRNSEYAIPYKQIDIGKPLWAAASGSNKKVTYALDLVSQPKGSRQLQKSLQSFIWTIYGKLVTYLTYVSMLGIIILVFCYKKINIRDDIYVILFLLLFVVLSRVALFALIDASSWPGNQPRYLFPAMPVYSCLLLLFIYKVFCVMKDIIKPPKAIMQN